MRNYIPILLVTATVVFTQTSLPIEPTAPVEPMQMSLPAPTAAVLIELVNVTTKPLTPAYLLKEWERTLICRVMMSECPYEPTEGQRAVAQVILDRIQNPEYPDTVYDVLTQNRQFAAPSTEDTNNGVVEAVSAIFDRGERVTEDELLYFYAPRYGRSGFHEAQTFICQIGNHKFYK